MPQPVQPTVVLVHGAFADASGFGGVIRELAACRYRAVAPPNPLRGLVGDAVACIGAWATDFRADLPKIDVPMLVVQGDADRVLPIDKTSKRLPGLIQDLQPVVVEGGPHAISWTHADQVNTALLDFLRY